MKRNLSLLLVLAMLLLALTGCTSTEVRSYSEDAAAENEDVFANALTAYPSDKQVGTINGTPVYWNEYAYNLAYYGSQMANYSEDGTVDWSAVYDEDSGETYGQLLQESAIQGLKQYHIIEAKAAEYGVEFGDEGEAFVQDMVDQTRVGMLGEEATEEDLAEALRTNYYVDMDVMRYQGKIQYLYDGLFAEIFGENGEKVTDEEVAEFIQESGYLHAKHILWQVTDEEGNELSEAEKQSQLQKAQAAAAELQAITDQKAREARFDEIMNAESQDPGLEYYPDGYVFGTGEMYKEFETGAAALEEYQVSDVVTTAAGYHVILRLPLDGDTVIDQDTDGKDITVRYAAASQNFNALADGWVEEAEVVWENGFDNLDLDKVFQAKSGGFFQKLLGK